jgi:hypothetical protein
MFSLDNAGNFSALGVPDSQIYMIGSHLQLANSYVFEDKGVPGAFDWLRNSLDNTLDPETADMLHGIVERNYVETPIVYAEKGYDSCQSHRALSKIAGEAISVGGLLYESRLLGLSFSLSDSLGALHSQLDIQPREAEHLTALAIQYGARQDFIFPGVSPSTSETPSLEQMTFGTLVGRPETSVRTITGVGGLRADQEWNHVTDLISFVELKMTEDKRYYPGMGIFYLLQKYTLDDLPATVAIKTNSPGVYSKLRELQYAIKAVKPVDFEGISILCASYLPSWSEMKSLQGFTSSATNDLASDFHSPSYEFAFLRALFEGAVTEEKMNIGFDGLKQALGRAWSFNSTIHLPWTAELAGLSNDLMGKVTNKVGDYATRFGLGHAGKSLEIVEYNFGKDRRFPFGVALNSTVILRKYKDSDLFEGGVEEQILSNTSSIWIKIKRHGFLKAAVEELRSS